MTKARQFENALVSFVMDYPAILDEEGVRDLQPSDFENGNGEVWREIQKAHQDGGVSIPRIVAALPGQGYDMPYFAALKRDNIGVTWSGAVDMARNLKLHSRRVQLRQIATEIAQAAARNDKDALTIASDAIDKLAALTRESSGDPELVGSALAEVREYIEIWTYCPTCWDRTEQVFQRDNGRYEEYRCEQCGIVHQVAVR